MNRAVGISLALAAVLGVASIAIVYLSEASINYSLYPYLYQKIDNQWYTVDNIYSQNTTSFPETFTRIDCQNKGSFDGTFYIIIRLTNATFSENSFQPSQLINSQTIKLSFTLHGREVNSTNVYFKIDNHASQFVISIAFQTNQLFIRHAEANWAGQSEFPYDMWANNTWAPIQIS